MLRAQECRVRLAGPFLWNPGALLMMDKTTVYPVLLGVIWFEPKPHVHEYCPWFVFIINEFLKL